MLKRVITGVLGVAAIVAVIIYGGRLGITLLALVGCFGALFEFFIMLFVGREKRLQQLMGIVAGAALSILIIFHSSLLYEGISVVFILLFLGYLLLIHISGGHQQQLFSDLTHTLFGIFYVAFLFSFWPKVRALDQGDYWIFLVFLIPWISDTVAYLVGKKFGKRKLAITISPNKTQEGALAGVVAAMVGTFIYSALFFDSLGIIDCLIIGGVGAVVSQLGDLFESFIKRALDVKDSGVVVPGHGGILDRFDSVLFFGPFIYFYAVVIGV